MSAKIKFIAKKIMSTILPVKYYGAIRRQYHKFCYQRLYKQWKKHYRYFFIIADPAAIPHEALAPSFFSQRGQDWFLATYCFPGQHEGFFLDIGANHPQHNNNTLYFENIGWHGLAFEPQVNLQRLWADQRITPCIPCALGDCETTITFNRVISNQWEHALSFVDGTTDYISSNLNIEKISVPQRALSNILCEKNINNIDFISIDVEGYELNVLNGIDFSTTYIKYFIIENDQNIKGNDDIRYFMQQHGYIYIANLCGDDVFCHKNNISNYESNLNKF